MFTLVNYPRIVRLELFGFIYSLPPYSAVPPHKQTNVIVIYPNGVAEIKCAVWNCFYVRKDIDLLKWLSKHYEIQLG